MTAKTRNRVLLLIALVVLSVLAVGWWWLGTHSDKPLETRTREEIQRQLVGNWRSIEVNDDGENHVLAFDNRWRVSFDGQGTGMQEFHPDLRAGRVTYEIETSAGLPVLQIKYPPGADEKSQRFLIRRLAPDALEFAEDGAESEDSSIAFRRMPGELLSAINDDESVNDTVKN